MNKRDYFLTIFISFLIFSISYTIVYRLTNTMNSDYAAHMSWAVDLPNNIWKKLTYPMWHIGVWIVYKINQLIGTSDVAYACAVSTSMLNVLVFLCISYIFRVTKQKHVEIKAFAVCMIGPIYIPWYSAQIYRGQGTPNVWHNPTSIMVKPFALLGTLLIINICSTIRRQEKVETRAFICLALLMACSVLAKPSFFQGIVPALGIYIIICLIIDKMKSFRKYVYLCLCFVPSFLIVIWQFWISFFNGGGEGIGIGWFIGFASYTKNWFVSLILVLLFPIIYLLFNLKKKYKSTAVHIIVLFTIVSWLQFALIYEKGDRLYHGNFSWAVLLAYSVAWVFSSRAFFKDWEMMDINNRLERRKNLILLGAFLLHLLCGVFYVYKLMTVENMLF